ncbi:hypothetical protein Misp03_46670 [Microbispora sp. NBRC 16548]|nr:hypothetical protein Misp03_46670 [Microbispora sp. NBRC 16548]
MRGIASREAGGEGDTATIRMLTIGLIPGRRPHRRTAAHTLPPARSVRTLARAAPPGYQAECPGGWSWQEDGVAAACTGAVSTSQSCGRADEAPTRAPPSTP